MTCSSSLRLFSLSLSLSLSLFPFQPAPPAPVPWRAVLLLPPETGPDLQLRAGGRGAGGVRRRRIPRMRGARILLAEEGEEEEEAEEEEAEQEGRQGGLRGGGRGEMMGLWREGGRGGDEVLNSLFL